MRKSPASDASAAEGAPRKAKPAGKKPAGEANPAGKKPEGKAKSEGSSRRREPGLGLWTYDRELLAEFPVLCGVDEAGRGPLAGPVVAACVILDLESPPIAGLNDSKQLTEEEREALYPQILARARAYGVGEGSPEEIDRFNILGATFLAMQRALAAMEARSLGEADGKWAKALVLVDGNQRIPDIRRPQRCLVKGDGTSASIAAASVLAKVTRDRMMKELDGLHPEYGFASHKGYGTAVHQAAISRHGLCPFHRRSFCLEEVRQESLFGDWPPPV